MTLTAALSLLAWRGVLPAEPLPGAVTTLGSRHLPINEAASGLSFGLGVASGGRCTPVQLIGAADVPFG